MPAAEIGQGRAVDDRTGRRAQAPFQQGFGIGAGDSVHGIKTHAETGTRQQSGNALKVKQRFE